jgi:hypothetical protein
MWRINNMKYVVDRLEDEKIILINMDTKEELVKDARELSGIVIGDVVYHDADEDTFIVDTKARIERMKDIRTELNDVLELDVEE